MNYYAAGQIKAAEDFGYAPTIGTLAKVLPVPFSAPLAAGIAAGAEGEGRDTNESMTRGLYAGGGNLVGSILGSLAGAAGGGLLGGGLAALGSTSRPKRFGFFGPRQTRFDGDMFGALAPSFAHAGAIGGGVLGNIIGGHKGTKAGIRAHRKAESERSDHARKNYEGSKPKSEEKDKGEKDDE